MRLRPTTLAMRFLPYFALLLACTATAAETELHRSPTALAVSPDRQLCVTANLTAHSVSLLDLATETVLQELPGGREPVDVVWVNHDTLAVSLRGEDAVRVLSLSEGRLEAGQLIPVGEEPGELVAADGSLWVVLTGDDALVEVDIASGKVTRKIPVGNRPRYVSLTPNREWLVTCCELPGEIFVHDRRTGKQLSRQRITDEAFNLGRPAFSGDSALCFLPVTINRNFPITKENIQRGWATNNRLVRLKLPFGPAVEQFQMGLDSRGQAMGDLNTAVLSPEGNWLAVTAGGTHELALLNLPRVHWPTGDADDFLPHHVREQELLHRIPLGGRPLDVQFVDTDRLLVANHLRDSVQVVSLSAGQVTRTIPLGGPAEPDVVRQGEEIFYDAKRSLHGWFSCHTCHPDGHTSGQLFDTDNDGGYGTEKLTPSLLGTGETGPWTWHGWQSSLLESGQRSLVSTLSSEPPVRIEDARALEAFLRSLPLPEPRQTDLTPEQQRGQQIFSSVARCTECHLQPALTIWMNFPLPQLNPSPKFDELNPPSLRGLSQRRRYLHDGRGRSLEQVLKFYHRPVDTTGVDLNDRDRHDLIEWLNTL